MVVKGHTSIPGGKRHLVAGDIRRGAFNITFNNFNTRGVSRPGNWVAIKSDPLPAVRCGRQTMLEVFQLPLVSSGSTLVSIQQKEVLLLLDGTSNCGIC